MKEGNLKTKFGQPNLQIEKSHAKEKKTDSGGSIYNAPKKNVYQKKFVKTRSNTEPRKRMQKGFNLAKILDLEDNDDDNISNNNNKGININNNNNNNYHSFNNKHNDYHQNDTHVHNKEKTN
ncbi:hypothetical protein M0812_10825 [Anaeramoeba flamelloides]|uniref:Uncharacterized protein n=1 Tax=Anaeramoeba flamelloides TaxID=1746091 RepID=A0AAV7ZX47_9EUKA|nr:hypothetical protein M0812_10825 [Anaeramoeba flamelloides]